MWLCSHPFIYFPAFFTVKAIVEQRPHPLEHAYHKWRNEVWESCKALWTLWVPGQIVNFAFVPRHLRVPFGGCTLSCARIDLTLQGFCSFKHQAVALVRLMMLGS